MMRMYGSELLESLNALNGNGPCAAILRHAPRHPIADIRRSQEVGLTEEGKEEAMRFGSQLRGFSQVRLYFSPAVRCRETAEAMIAGLEGNGTVVAITGPEGNLCAPYLKNEACLTRAAQIGKGFIREWFDGKLDPASILGTRPAAALVIAPIIARLSEPGGGSRLDVHVSHDWEISLLREELLGIPYEEAGWPEYLDGIVFRPDGEGHVASYRTAASPIRPASR